VPATAAGKAPIEELEVPMPTWGWIVIAVLAILLVCAVAWIAYARRRSARLQRTFGPEYDRTVRSQDSRARAESELAERARRRKQFEVRDLPPEVRQRYLVAWRATQGRFVDEPGQAVDEADALVTHVMRDRGYPMEDFEQRAADVSVDHPDVVENYRRAHAISAANREGRAETEDLRQAFVHYRSLFEELLGVTDQGQQPQREAR
jgi:hypothetical protein